VSEPGRVVDPIAEMYALRDEVKHLKGQVELVCEEQEALRAMVDRLRAERDAAVREAEGHRHLLRLSLEREKKLLARAETYRARALALVRLLRAARQGSRAMFEGASSAAIAMRNERDAARAQVARLEAAAQTKTVLPLDGQPKLCPVCNAGTRHEWFTGYVGFDCGSRFSEKDGRWLTDAPCGNAYAAALAMRQALAAASAPPEKE
jgi:hypothetical protein